MEEKIKEVGKIEALSEKKIDDSPESFAKLLEEIEQQRAGHKEGELIKGKVVKVQKDFVLVDVGLKSEGKINILEFGTKIPKEGDEVEVLLEQYEDDDGLIVLSKEKADKIKVWDDINRAYENNLPIEGTIVAKVNKGLSVDIGVRAFLPGSHVDLRPVKNFDKLIGTTAKFKIIKFNKKRGNIVLSRRQILEEERERQRKETLEKLKEGDIVKGIVKNITEYGVFIDLGGVDGLLHISDITWGRINHPEEMFKVGDEVTVKVLKFDKANEKVSLGIKQMTEDPWLKVHEKYPIGSRVKGKIVSLPDYGIFVEIEPGVEGLVHVSEISWTKKAKNPLKMFNIGDTIEAMVLDVDPANRRISLGIKQLEPNPWLILKEKFPIGTKVKGKIKNITDFGVFVGVDEGIDGLVHISDLTWSQRIKHPGELYKKGDEVEAVVLNVDVENERFSLGIKQLTPDPWTKFTDEYTVGSKVQGKVVKVTDFGAFVEIIPGVEGLLHVSEMKEERIDNPKQVVKEGDTVRVMIIDINHNDRKVALSMKALAKLGEDEDFRAYQQKEEEAKSKLGDILKQEGILDQLRKNNT